MSWVFVTKQFVENGNEYMLAPMVSNYLAPRKSKLIRALHFGFDMMYYVGKYIILRKITG